MKNEQKLEEFEEIEALQSNAKDVCLQETYRKKKEVHESREFFEAVTGAIEDTNEVCTKQVFAQHKRLRN